MGRWKSDVYELYCRMSVEAALGVGLAIASAAVAPLSEVGFHEERLEYQPDELEFLRGETGDGGDDGGEDGEVGETCIRGRRE